MRLILLILRPVYYLLYHHFAWTYDLVADIVSLGQWRQWIQVALPHQHGRILELGFGPGHLQLFMQEQDLPAFGLDESRFMARQASKRLKKAGCPSRLSRSLAQHMPFPASTFDTVTATFPAEYISNPLTLDEIRRVLTPGGSLVVLPLAWVTGVLPWERLIAWLMRITGEAAGQPGFLPASACERFSSHGFDLHQELVTLPRSRVLVLTARKTPAGSNSPLPHISI